MEVILDCFFEHFEKLDRDTLHARYKRREMVEYFNTMIEGCCRGEESTPEKAVREAILGILKYHQRMRNQNGNVCMGKYHNILYVAVKLCYSWQLKDPKIVSTLLKEIYTCEKTFERIFLGAIFGTRAPHYIAGWKSDFNDQEENLRAMVYFLDQARTAQLELESRRFIDVPLESCGKENVLRVCIELGLPDKVHILLRFGALVSPQKDVVEFLLDRLNEFNHVYPYNIVACLQLVLRVLPRFGCEEAPHTGNVVVERYPDLVEDGLIPPRRCGLEPAELKHLSRCCVRQRLWLLHQLPNGIHLLPIPDTLKRYLDLMSD